MLEQLNEWGYQLHQTLQPMLEAGSLTAVLVVFAAGVLTSFTPCVYPMIPVTVTFMGSAAAGNRRLAFTLSSIYVAGMAVVYAALGVISASLGEKFGSFTRNPWVFGAVAVVIAVLGLAMLDKISIPVPGFVAGVQTSGVRRGGWLGALLMGMAAGFVAAPCTAPVLGALLIYVANTGDVIWGGFLLTVFAVGLGFLLLIVGIFSGLLANLPSAGGWMSWVKKLFAFGMFAVALWFLVQAVTMWRAG